MGPLEPRPFFHLRVLGSLLGMLLVLSACSGTDPLPGPSDEEDPRVGIPVLDPLPLAPDAEHVRFTVPESDWQKVDIVGLPGAVSEAGEVTVTSAEETVTVMATDEGTFVAAVQASAGDTVSLRFRTSITTEVVIEGVVPPGPVDSRIDHFPTAVDGFVDWSIEARPGATVIVTNPSNGAVVVTVAETSGDKARATFRIAAQSGDVLKAFVDGPPLSDPVSIPID